MNCQQQKKENKVKTITSNEVKIGGWTYYPETLVVSYGVDEYEVDLEQCSTSAQMLCQIWQFADNSSATNESLGDLILILKLLLDPEANLIFRGKKEKPLPKGEALRKLIAEHIRKREVFNQWEQSMRGKQGTSVSIVTPEDWQDLRRMEREAG